MNSILLLALFGMVALLGLIVSRPSREVEWEARYHIKYGDRSQLLELMKPSASDLKMLHVGREARGITEPTKARRKEATDVK